jgi:hypothetical protein
MTLFVAMFKKLFEEIKSLTLTTVPSVFVCCYMRSDTLKFYTNIVCGKNVLMINI